MQKRTAIVTFPTQGSYSETIALRLAQDGFDIAICGSQTHKALLDDLQQEVSAKGVQCRGYIVNFTSEEDVKGVVDSVVNHFGSLDVMVANLLHFSSVSPLIDTSIDSWDKSFELNTRSAFLFYKYAAMQMIKQGRGGSIIGSSATSGLQAWVPNLTSFCANAFAIRGLTQSAALELGPHAITANAFAPGSIKNEQHRTTVEKIHQSSQLDVPNLVNSRTPLAQKSGTPEDVAGVVSFLASKEARFITGQTISVNGGLYMT
ncbi:uncharacterized protein EV420DRAFT_296253 [Desarmillaria tabescens]|uniref:NAD(P)-binding protein n=1 Tax=Armillaria tabescens TaxID=1929756 RepID=A0AA39MJ35_ARMTA|nr:uncharacterized protein EV420DRAFT_296253 [Desarmillaria tabescens]KAK0435708.1 hypothetical protein EV420DRAFT_296253 [Desarmillaria tabescens]